MDFFAMLNGQYRAGGLKFLIFQSFCPVVKKGFFVFYDSVATDFRFLFRDFFLSKFFTSEIA